MNAKQIFIWIARICTLLLLFSMFFIGGSMFISGMLPDVESEPGLIEGSAGFLFFAFLNVLIIILLIFSSRWHGWKLAMIVGLAYYGAVAFLIQIESWYFMSNITFDQALVPRLFLMGLPVAFLYIPLAILILGRWKKKDAAQSRFNLRLPAMQWMYKLSFIAVIYMILYWLAGYYIAWQNADLRAFYGSPGEILPFIEQTVTTYKSGSRLFSFQALRGILWALCAIPIIRGSKVNVWWTAILVGLFFTIPQVSGLIIENPLMPKVSVRLSHMIEVISTNIIFGMIIVWLLHKEHRSLPELFRLS